MTNNNNWQGPKKLIEKPSPSFSRMAFSRFFRHKLGVFGLAIFLLFSLAAILSNQITPHSIAQQNLRNRFSPPTIRRVIPTGISASSSISVLTMNNGEIYSEDLVFGIPSWYQNLEEQITTPPIIAHEYLFIGTEENNLKALNLINGTTEWKIDLESPLEKIWKTSEGILIRSGEKFALFNQDGEKISEVVVAGTLKRFFGEMNAPLIINGAGELISFSWDGEKEVLSKFKNPSPEIAFSKDKKVYYFANGYLYSYNLISSESKKLGLTPRNPSEPVYMNIVGETVFLAFKGGLTMGFDLEKKEKVWERTHEGEIIASRSGEESRIHTYWNNGRHRIINLETGGITSSRTFTGFSDIHLLGTDELGRDVFSRIVAAARISLSLGVIVALISVSVGTIVGATSGYFGGIVDSIIMRFVDFMLSIPSLPILMLLTYILGPSFETMIIALSIIGWMSIARVVRSQTLSLKEQDFSKAAKALGATNRRIIIRHIIPNTLAPVLVAMTLQVAGAILSESQLSFLGLGIQPPTPSWGNMLMNSRQYLTTAPWLAIWPGLCIFLTLISINFVGDAVRDALDPKLKRS